MASSDTRLRGAAVIHWVVISVYDSAHLSGTAYIYGRLDIHAADVKEMGVCWTCLLGICIRWHPNSSGLGFLLVVGYSLLFSKRIWLFEGLCISAGG